MSNGNKFSYKVNSGIVECFLDKKFVGFLSWHSDGTIAMVSVSEAFQRQGVASEMFRLAKEINPDLHHSKRLTTQGSSWSVTLT